VAVHRCWRVDVGFTRMGVPAMMGDMEAAVVGAVLMRDGVAAVVVGFLGSCFMRLIRMIFRNRYRWCLPVVMLLGAASPSFCQVRSGVGGAVYRALLIGNSDYSGNTWQPLRTSVNDVRKIAEVLIERYGFERKNVQVLENVDRRRLIKGFLDLAAVSKPEDSVLVYYAGHGDTDRSNSSWWVPVAAEQSYDYISGQEIALRLQLIPAQHRLLLVDSCFSGNLFGEKRLSASEKPLHQVDSAAMAGSVQVISSGGDGPVSDGGPLWGGHSVFAYHLIAQLKAHANRELTAEQLAGSLIRFVSRDTRQMGREQQPRILLLQAPGQGGGQFTFTVHDVESESGAKGLLLAFLCDRETDFDVLGGESRELLFRELIPILQRNGLRIVNQPLCVTYDDLAGVLRLKLEDLQVSRALLVKLDLVVEKQQTRIWSALAKADAMAQVFVRVDGTVVPGDVFRLQSQMLPVDHWEETQEYRKAQYKAVAAKLAGSFREPDFAAFLRYALD